MHTLPILVLVCLAQKSDPADAERVAFARKFEKAIAEGDATAATGQLDVDTLLDVVTGGHDPGAPYVLGFRAGVKKSFALCRQLCDNSRGGGSYRFLRMAGSGVQARALFRLLTPAGQCNYHAWIYGTGAMRFIDAQVYMTGELLSDPMRRAFLAVVAQSKGSLNPGERDLLEGIPQLQAMQKLKAEGKHAEAIAAYRRMPAGTQKLKSALLLRMQAAFAGDDEEEYAAAIADYEAAYPGDPSLDLVAVDGLLIRKDYDGALARIDRLYRALGGDPYLDVLRANVLWAAQRAQKAKEHADAAIRDEPTLVPAYWTRITIALGEKDHRETARLLLVVEKKLGQELADLTEIEEYAEFVTSPEYQEWMKERGQ